MSDLKNKGFSTRSIHSDRHENEYGSLTFPIYATSTMVFPSAEVGGRRFAHEDSGFKYSRLGNPSTTYLAEKIASLENCEAALCCSSGMAAISSALMTVMKAGDHLICDKAIYGGTYALFEQSFPDFGIEVTFVEQNNLDEIKAAIKPNTKVLYLETPVNPTMKVMDLEVLSAFAKEHNLITVADNTISTPYITRPKDYGIDIIVHSGTKYLNGHGDVIAGFVAGDKDFIDKCTRGIFKDLTAAVMSPFDAFLINRGLKTLRIRVKEHCENAQKVAEFLYEHPAVKKVYYPGLPSHETHEIAKKQMNGMYTGLLSFELKGGFEAGKQVANNLKIFSLAVSLGDCESLIQHPASMTHSPYSREDLKKADIDLGLLRASIGLEDIEDIIDDLKTELDKLI